MGYIFNSVGLIIIIHEIGKYPVLYFSQILTTNNTIAVTEFWPSLSC
jgi:hypothetical protein